MEARLLVAHANADAKQIRLGVETLIGRSPECNLRIASGQVSRRHCRIRVEEAQVSVRDLGSANGTRLNGQTIAPEIDVPVPPGSTLVVGPLKFIVQFTPPKSDDDTEYLSRTAECDSSELRELTAMAAAPVVDGEETKDYPPSRTRKRGVPPPLTVSGELHGTTGAGHANVDAAGDRNRSVQAHSTEAEFGPVSGETVFDVSLEDHLPDVPRAAGDAGPAARTPIVGAETDFLFEEDDLRRLQAAIFEDTPTTPGAAIEPPANVVPGGGFGNVPAPDDSTDQPGWHLLDVLRRKKKPADPASTDASRAAAAPAPDDVDDTLRNFLKDE